MITYELATVDDLDALLAIRMEALKAVFSFRKGIDYSSLEKPNREYYERHIPDGSHLSVLVKDDGRVIGCGGICFQEELPSPDNPTGKNAYFMNVYVREAYRNRGIGTAVMNRLVAIAKERGSMKLYLESTPLGRKIYYKMGFADYPYFLHLKADGEN